MMNFGKLRIVGILLSAAILMPVLSACGGDTPAGPTATPTTPAMSNADLLKAAAANMKAAKSYHIDADIDQAGTQVKMVGDIDITGNNAELNMNTQGQEVHVIVIGEDAYVATGGGTDYQKAPASALNLESFINIWNNFKPEDVDKAGAALKDATPATETIDGVATKHITGDAKELSALTTQGSSATSQEGTVDLWISTDATPYIYQMRINGTSDGNAIDGTFKWNKFNETFDIKAPEGQ
ncbi:MAG: LppX_LprAFG lipoprotein [Chloroflexota bacterium]|nr:LppX_LprAFG lipoprotein [Chloroflexota bacterium]